MLLRQRQQKRLLSPNGKRAVFRCPCGLRADKTAVELPGQKRGELGGRREIGHLHLAGGMTFLKPLDETDQALIEERPDKSQPKPRYFTLTGPPDRFGGTVQVAENGPRILQEQPARIGQRHRMGVAVEEARP